MIVCFHDDLDRIVKDLRTRHESDKTTAKPETPAADFARNIPVILLDALMHKGTADEKRTFTICRVFGIDYMSLPEEERATLARVFKKSPLLPVSASQRGKSKLLSLFGNRYHPLHAVPADDVDLLGCPDGLPAFGANQLACTGRPPAAVLRSSCAGP